MHWGIALVGALLVTGSCAYFRTSLTIFSLAIAAWLFTWTVSTPELIIVKALLWSTFAIVFGTLNIRTIRQKILSERLLKLFKRYLPTLSETEQEALEAGSVSWDGELFTGKLEWHKLYNQTPPKLTAEEQAFLDGPVEELCSMIDDWHITHERYDLTPETWQFMRDNGFFGMIIPKSYGGLEFSAYAHSQVLVKVASRSMMVSSIVGVPNSLGPAELILHYGTQEQKDTYLPKLATGEEFPCFALTGPEAGSDAGAIPDNGVICRGNFKGEEVIGIKLNWDKRYITLAPKATVLGLAFKLYDPECLIGDTKDYGITCALIPTSHNGVEIGKRHFPLNMPFPNGPTRGEDVFIPLDWIIGGVDMAGKGWKMLVECLSVGRSITLPSSAAGYSKLAVQTTSAYATIRQQFKMQIGQFEGVAEALARMIGFTYLMDSTRTFTAHLVDLGEKPSVPSAVAKYHITELGRKVMQDAMDIHGGKGIMMGPNNYLGRTYQGVPVAITVEGANILTRSLIIFGQGAMRCHPYVLDEVHALQEKDAAKSLDLFDKTLFKHIGFTISNAVRAFWLSLSRGKLSKAPAQSPKQIAQHMNIVAAQFALAADFSLLVLGASLKRKEILSARLGDVFSQLYLCSAALKHFSNQGAHSEDLAVLEWACQDALYLAQEQLIAVTKNFPNKIFATLLKVLLFPLGKPFSKPKDELTLKIAHQFLATCQSRSRLIDGMYFGDKLSDAGHLLEEAFEKWQALLPTISTVKQAIKSGKLSSDLSIGEQLAQAFQERLIDASALEAWSEYDALRKAVIAVDEFDEDYFSMKTEPTSVSAKAVA